MIQVRDDQVGELGVLFERYHQRLFQFCLRMTGSPQVSEDLVQEVFMRMLKYRHTFHDNSHFLPWMYRMAHNACADHFRKHRRTDPLDESHEAAATTAHDIGIQVELEQAESITLLRRALLKLPVEKREVLILSRFESRKYDEIAELLDCSIGAVKVRVHRAIGELRRSYFELLEEVSQ